MGLIRGHVTYFLKFLDPLHFSGRLQLKTSKFAHRLATGGPKRNKAKLGQKGSINGQVAYFLKFWDPSISRERLKLETSNLADRLATGGPYEKMQN